MGWLHIRLVSSPKQGMFVWGGGGWGGVGGAVGVGLGVVCAYWVTLPKQENLPDEKNDKHCYI